MWAVYVLISVALMLILAREFNGLADRANAMKEAREKGLASNTVNTVQESTKVDEEDENTTEKENALTAAALSEYVAEINNPHSGRLPPPMAEFSEPCPAADKENDDTLYMVGALLPQLLRHSPTEPDTGSSPFNLENNEDEQCDEYQEETGPEDEGPEPEHEHYPY